MIGAVDIGTNSVRLLICRKHDSGAQDGAFEDILRLVEVTRLGEGVNSTRTIKPEAMERTLETLGRYKELMERHGVEKVRVVSTSAMRDAKNSADFIALTKERLGLDIEVISGKEEGQLTFAGALGPDSLVPPDLPVVVIDVGGGSTEFIYGVEGELFGATSIDIGSVRLSELLFKHDPPLAGEIENVRDMIEEMAAPLLGVIASFSPSAAVAVAGTATQLAALKLELEPYDPKIVHGSRISRRELRALIDKLAVLNIEERKALKGMHPQRADVIVAGALILDEALSAINVDEMSISEHDILDGIAYSIS